MHAKVYYFDGQTTTIEIPDFDYHLWVVETDNGLLLDKVVYREYKTDYLTIADEIVFDGWQKIVASDVERIEIGQFSWMIGQIPLSHDNRERLIAAAEMDFS